jgi:transcriptional regulator with XRE-family HTH domain/Zn-dependent peptidase ImmA (M78 family)
MDKSTLGARITAARDAAGRTQSELAREMGIDRSAVSRLEAGDRKLDINELLTLCSALDIPLTYLVSEEPQAVVSRRREGTADGGSPWSVDTALHLFSHDVAHLQRMGLVDRPARLPALRTPRSHEEAEQYAGRIRRALDLSDGPITDLGAVCEAAGLLVHVIDDLEGDGAFVAAESTDPPLGVAVVNGSSKSGRRRMTVAHELGHWVFGDAHDHGASWDESMIFSFAIHFLAPRSAVLRDWNRDRERNTRDRALWIAATFRLSWSAALDHLVTVGAIDHDHRELLLSRHPRRADYLRLRLDLREEPGAPYLTPGLTAGILDGYAEGRITRAKALELLRGTVGDDDLPDPRELTTSDMASAFLGHGG